MAPNRPDRPPALLDPVSPEMGDQLVEAWRTGAMVPPAMLSGPVRVELAGVGERFAAWRVIPDERAPLIVRIPHIAPDELHQDLDREIAALTMLPPGVGPAPIAVHAEAGTSALGHPYVVTTEVPGTAVAPGAWTEAHLRSHAEHLARLHAVPAPGRGAVSPGPEPWAAGPQRLLPEVEGEVASWQAQHGTAIREHGLSPLLEAALETVASVEGQIRRLDGFVLAHGDLCATNIMWDGRDAGTDRPRVRFIDFEWAQGDDPARDLSSLGGTVHGGPWYVPMTEEQVAGFVDVYVRARGVHGEVPDSVADVASLRERMRAWTAYERTAMLVHVAARAATGASHRRVLPVLRDTLAAALGVGS
ncbi:serine kinase [Brachybacterium vulturis]|uniref:Serine kinase n=1 Tax=Brachybacterium vulturis TaxID=2017484 RepID=A0A291GKA4_9MICO|nr:aminoglycoside phosphotransferase family protein [Brachybacterium vulturis]ATG50651.1 serine kinase [Brachybacterium vulturis]